jgi:transposase
VEDDVAEVIIGIDPHKGSHTAVALDRDEQTLARLRVKATAAQVDQLRRWAAPWPQRTWAIEGARGLGRLLAQQLVAAGEPVVDVQPKLAARVRLLNTGQVNKNDPNDARSVAVAALRAPSVSAITAENDTAAMKMWARRYRDLGSSWTQTVCRLHAVLCDLVPGGFARRISVPQAIQFLQTVQARTRADVARLELARELVQDLQRIDAQRRQVKRRLAAVVAASKSTLTEIHGVGPVVAATVLGFIGDIDRFASRDHFAAYNGTAPIEVSSGNRRVHRLSRRGNRQLNHAVHMAAVTQIRNPGTAGHDYYHRKLDEGMGRKAALRALKRKISDTIYNRLAADARPSRKDPGGQTGNDSASSAASSHPATPALRTSHSRAGYKPTSASPVTTPPTNQRRQPVDEPLDNKEGSFCAQGARQLQRSDHQREELSVFTRVDCGSSGASRAAMSSIVRSTPSV